jgi:CheY-like chemotaxis protein
VLVGEKQLVSVYLIDKTEKRDFESRILEQNKRLKEFAFLTSHKLRQPLANILGLIELVKSESQSQQDVTITFETLRMLTGQLDDVVHQMSDALTELDMEAEKSLFFNEPEETGINEIWIVDDDQVITYITERLLHNADPSLKVSGYLSAKMALEKLRLDNDCPDVLLLDINMPGISGWEFLDELNKLGRFVNIYMYSSSIDPEDVKRARAYPMVREFLSKPLDMKTINHLLDMPVLHRKVS